MKFAFVILHYLTIEDTCECVDSILNNIEDEVYSIIVVDNGSYNDSLNQLHKIYNDNNKVYIIESGVNIGFAKGNNLGFAYAKNVLQANFVIMINNDTVINQNDFLTKIKKTFNETRFDVLGPDIISLVDNKHQNPYKMNYKRLNEKRVRRMILVRYRDLILTYLHLYKFILAIYYIFFQKTNRKYFKKQNSLRTTSDDIFQFEQTGLKLHGSCLIFSPNFIMKYNGLYSKTFMYLEEEILFFIAQKENLKLVYSPNMKIFHKEDSATNTMLKSNEKKRIFILKNEIESAKELLKMIKDETVYKADMIDKSFNEKQLAQSRNQCLTK